MRLHLFHDMAQKMIQYAQKERPVRQKPKIAGEEKQTVQYTKNALQNEKSRVPKTKELVVISGKGGTGKTSLVASFCSLNQKMAIADCDVDAADLHLILQPEIKEKGIFSGGDTAQIDPSKCTVIEHYARHTKPVLRRCTQLVARHLESPVPRRAYDLPVWGSELGGE